MTTPTTQSLSSLVSTFASTVQGRASQLINFTIGSTLRALAEAVSGVALWLQGLALQALALSRASTSAGADLDSWFTQFGFARLIATYATGNVTFSRLTATNQALIPIGALVQTSDGSQQFSVIVNAGNAAYNAGLNGYVINAGVTSLAVPVQAVTAGAAGNVAASTITVLAQSIPYVDTVANSAQMTGGQDAETDAAALARFQLWVNSLSKATKAAIGAAIQSVQAGLTYQIFEGVNYAGSPQYWYFYAIVDDGTGAPSNTLLTNVINAVDAARPIGTTFNVYAPVIVHATVSLTVTVAAGYVPSQVASAVQAAIQSYINSLGMGVTLPYAKLTQLAFTASNGVANVSNVVLNGGSSDLTCTNQQVIKYSSVTVATA